MLDISHVVRSAIWLGRGHDTSLGGPLIKDDIRDPRYRALQRDHFVCAGCGLRASPVPDDFWGGLEAHHKDDDAGNNSLDNLVTVCPICHGLLHFPSFIGTPGLAGRFLWTRHLSQPLLNMVTHISAMVEVFCQNQLCGGTGRVLCGGQDAVIGAGIPGGGLSGGAGVSSRLDSALSADAGTCLALRDRCRDICAALDNLPLPRGVLLSPSGMDLAPVLEIRPGFFAKAAGDFLRSSPGRARRERLASRLAPLRWFVLPRADVWARIYANSPIWHMDGRWALHWSGAANWILDQIEAGI